MWLAFAPAWSIFFVNAGFLGTALEAGAKVVSRAWLVLPLLWFGGYEIAALYSHYQVYAIQQQVADQNARKRFAFSPQSHSLVLEGGLRFESLPGVLIESYGLPIVYESISSTNDAVYKAFHLSEGDECQSIWSTQKSAKIEYIESYTDHRHNDRTTCLWASSENPVLPEVRISAKFMAPEADYLLNRISIAEVGGQSVDLDLVKPTPLPWLPMPVMGCTPGPQFSGWKCSAYFWREGWIDIHSQADTTKQTSSLAEVLADTLGLQVAN